jgi:hypothetical protein
MPFFLLYNTGNVRNKAKKAYSEMEDLEVRHTIRSIDSSQQLGVHFIPYFVHSMNKKRILGVQYIGLHHFRFAIVTDEFGTDHDPVWLGLIANDTWIR